MIFVLLLLILNLACADNVLSTPVSGGLTCFLQTSRCSVVSIFTSIVHNRLVGKRRIRLDGVDRMARVPTADNCNRTSCAWYKCLSLRLGGV